MKSITLRVTLTVLQTIQILKNPIFEVVQRPKHNQTHKISAKNRCQRYFYSYNAMMLKFKSILVSILMKISQKTRK